MGVKNTTVGLIIVGKNMVGEAASGLNNVDETNGKSGICV